MCGKRRFFSSNFLHTTVKNKFKQLMFSLTTWRYWILSVVKTYCYIWWYNCIRNCFARVWFRRYCTCDESEIFLWSNRDKLIVPKQAHIKCKTDEMNGGKSKGIGSLPPTTEEFYSERNILGYDLALLKTQNPGFSVIERVVSDRWVCWKVTENS